MWFLVSEGSDVPRRSIGLIDVPCCYHVTQRCQERRFLLRFKKDRKQYLQRLREAAAKYPVSVLDYMVTSNHVHLRVWAERATYVSVAMCYLSGAAAGQWGQTVFSWPTCRRASKLRAHQGCAPGLIRTGRTRPERARGQALAFAIRSKVIES